MEDMFFNLIPDIIMADKKTAMAKREPDKFPVRNPYLKPLV